MESPLQQRLEEYFNEVGVALGHKLSRESYAIYALGLLGEGERKSVEPIAARACTDPARVEAMHQKLLHFVGDAVWSDRKVRLVAARHGIAAITAHDPIEAWIIDDTGFLKQGTHSVGVQRQYTGSAGKIANCQVAASLSLATRTEHLPIDFELYLPESWMDDKARRKEAKIPRDLKFKTKPELALEMIRRAVAADIPRGTVLADVAYGNSSQFREGVRHAGLHYAVAVEGQTKVWLAGKHSRCIGEKLSIKELAQQIVERGGFRRTTWREGTKKDLSARFAVRRVIPAHDDSWQPNQREVVSLVMEWEDCEDEPTKCYFTSLPIRVSRKRIVRCIKQRWRTERVYEDMKGELGLDHFEGRSFPGWHHHVSAVLSCYAFVVSDRARRFPPSPRRAIGDGSHQLAA